MDFKEKEVKRIVIMDHYSNPKNKPIVRHPNSNIKRKNNSSCMDDIIVAINFANGKVVDATFEGIACAITTACADILLEMIKGKTKNETLKLIYKYKEMIKTRKGDDELGEAQVFQDASLQPNRLNCALMTADVIIEIIKEHKDEI